MTAQQSVAIFELQFGHAFSGMEIEPGVGGTWQTYWLQFGHAFSGMEISI